MGKVFDLLNANKEKIQYLKLEGKTYKEIGAIFSCSDTSVRNFCIKTGIRIPPLESISRF